MAQKQLKEERCVAQLLYSRTALIRRMILAAAAVPILLFVAVDPAIGSGHVRGFWGNLLHQIGPTGRWAIAAVLIAVLACLVARCANRLSGDQLALHANQGGLVMKVGFLRQELAWAHVRAIAIETRTIRRRTYNWIVVWSFDSGAERKIRVDTSLLDTRPGDVDVFLTAAQQILRDSRHPSPARREALPSLRFGHTSLRSDDQLAEPESEAATAGDGDRTTL